MIFKHVLTNDNVQAGLSTGLWSKLKTQLQKVNNNNNSNNNNNNNNNFPFCACMYMT